MLAQGATEYLVLLAVVLIVALVSVALLGFFPGMASDAKLTQSKAYWSGASPIAITETGAMASATLSWPYVRIRNTGAYPVRITKIIGDNAQSITQFYCEAACGSAGAYFNISQYFYLAPGEERYFGWSGMGMANMAFAVGMIGGSSSLNTLYSASSVCSTGAPYGTADINNFGFEYTEYVDGQQITKRQIGAKPLIIKCREPV